MDRAADAGLLGEIKTILRRDLKLGAEATIADDMPLVGGEMDLDSLDILLLVSSIEKHFKIKIPSEVVGRWVFQDVSTLARFVGDNREILSTANIPVAASPGTDWLAMLPHGPEFRFISKVTEVMPGQSARGEWIVDGSEAFFKGHFPGRPIVPGVLMVEAMAQIAGLAAAVGANGAHGTPGMLANVDVRFEAPVIPPATIELHASVSRSVGSLRQCEVAVIIAGKTVARGTVAIQFDATTPA